MTTAETTISIITTDHDLIDHLQTLPGAEWQLVPAAEVKHSHPHLIDLRVQIPANLAAQAEQAPLIGLVADIAAIGEVLRSGVHEVITMADLQPICLHRAISTAQIRWQIEQMRRQQLAEARAQVQALTVRLQNEQIRDPLTGLYTRRYLNETLERELRRADREQIVLSAVLIDIDQLDQVNWQFGRALGDAVIQHLATLIGRQVRGGDIFCRYGSDELLLLLPRVSRETILHRAEQWRASVAETIIRPGTLDLQVTISIGIATFPHDARNAVELLNQAHEALYAAKAAGGNCVRLWPGAQKQTPFGA
ncbi:GGDEF domain-containing protein [Chloroflexus aggregans]|uniref:Diguanylate cyclase n=1 Tax=Chloroflexus aggregans (strain MD-66 / DSM 9485) TaxID=326427 RepID=B8GC82_CHLAD|nr:GGDEF domain-containing protein [Chloroflexus aggregans]ACL23056.1 diguanylate cyclase [Chloroflexus aggregans DSM 9485]